MFPEILLFVCCVVGADLSDAGLGGHQHGGLRGGRDRHLEPGVVGIGQWCGFDAGWWGYGGGVVFQRGVDHVFVILAGGDDFDPFGGGAVGQDDRIGAVLLTYMLQGGAHVGGEEAFDFHGHGWSVSLIKGKGAFAFAVVVAVNAFGAP